MNHAGFGTHPSNPHMNPMFIRNMSERWYPPISPNLPNSSTPPPYHPYAENLVRPSSYGQYSPPTPTTAGVTDWQRRAGMTAYQLETPVRQDHRNPPMLPALSFGWGSAHDLSRGMNIPRFPTARSPSAQTMHESDAYGGIS